MAENKVQAKLEVPKAAWAKLNEADKILAESLGVVVKSTKAKKEKKVRQIILQSYTLRVVKTCKLCGCVQHRYFKMEDSGNGYLVGVRIDSLPEDAGDIRDKNVEVNHCSDCPYVLESFTKEELIAKLIEAVTNKGERR